MKAKTPKYHLMASCPNKPSHIRDMIAKCFYGTSNHAAYGPISGSVSMYNEVKPDWRIVFKGSRARLEYKLD